jgi:diguanylate cyclase (GGDEF)-like protein
MNDFTPFHQIFSNGMMLTVYGGLLVYFVLTGIKILANWKNVRLPNYLILIMASAFLWNTTSLLPFILQDESLIYIFSLLPYVFISVYVISIFFFVMRFYDQGVFVRRSFVIAISIFPVMTVVNIILGHMDYFGGRGFNLIRVDPYISTEGLNYVYGNLGQWHNLISLATQLIVYSLVIVAVTQHLKLPRIYRAPSEKLMAGIIMLAAGMIAFVLNAAGRGETVPVNFLLIASIFSTRFFYRATLGTQGLIFLSQARNDVIQHISQSILFLNEDENIIFKNNYASEWLAGLNYAGSSFPRLLERLAETSTECEKLSDEESGTDYHFDAGGRKSVFNLRQKPIHDKKGRQIGMYVIYSDVTENRELIRRLEVGAGRDVLTGLNNRSMMESLKRELDILDNLPLSVIIADLNDLKKTNDEHGHQSGDIMLRVCGEALSEKCPPTAQVGRIGGDEFLILLPKTAKLEAQEIIEGIREHLKAIDDYPYKIVMAMGFGVKDTADKDLSVTMEEADKEMYADKKKIKGGAEIRNMDTKLI